MELPTAAEALRALAANTANRSKIGRLRGLYNEIKEAQLAGVSNSKIVETLNTQGFNLTLKTFETMLYRVRKQQEEKGVGSRNTKNTEPEPITPPPPENSGTTESSSAARPESGEESIASDDLAGLDSKQRRELVADKFIGKADNPSSSLVKRLIKEKNK